MIAATNNLFEIIIKRIACQIKRTYNLFKGNQQKLIWPFCKRSPVHNILQTVSSFSERVTVQNPADIYLVLSLIVLLSNCSIRLIGTHWPGSLCGKCEKKRKAKKTWKIAYLTNIVTAVGVSARSMPFQDFEIWNFCRAFSGRRGSVSCLAGSGSLPFSAVVEPFPPADSSWIVAGLKQREHSVPISLSSLPYLEGSEWLAVLFWKER